MLIRIRLAYQQSPLMMPPRPCAQWRHEESGEMEIERRVPLRMSHLRASARKFPTGIGSSLQGMPTTVVGWGSCDQSRDASQLLSRTG